MTTTSENLTLTQIHTHAKIPDKRLGYLFAIGATVCWSGTGLFIDALTTHYRITPLELSFWRTTLVVIALGLFLLRGNRSKRTANFGIARNELGLYFFYGVIGVGAFNLAWSNSVAINKAAVATALLFCSPVFVVIGARWLFGEKVRLVGLLAIGLDLVGVFLVAQVYDLGSVVNNSLGLLYAVGSGLTFAIYTLSGKAAAHANRHSSTTGLFYAFAFALGALLIWGLIQEGGQLFTIQLDWVGWLGLILLSYGPTLGGYAFFSLAIKRLEANVVSIFTTLEPPIAASMAALFLGRVLNPIQWLGAVFIVGGVLLLQSVKLKRRVEA